MAQPDSSLTPEKKLLKLIEDPQSVVAGQKSGSDRGGVAAVLSPSALKGRIAFFQDRAVQFFKDPKEPVNLRQVNQAAKWITIALAVYLLVMIALEIMTVYRDYEGEFKIVPKQMAEMPEVEERKLDQMLFEEVQKRNVFISQEKRLPAADQNSQSTSIRLVDQIKDLRLTGISVDPENSERTYCMVEDVKKNVTSFLKVGDSIAGLKVDQISQDGVILKYQKESIELK